MGFLPAQADGTCDRVMPVACAVGFEVVGGGPEDLGPVERVAEDAVAPLADHASAALRAGLVLVAAGQAVVVDDPALTARLGVTTDPAPALGGYNLGPLVGVEPVAADLH